jgi:hypothetical protein
MFDILVEALSHAVVAGVKAAIQALADLIR